MRECDKVLILYFNYVYTFKPNKAKQLMCKIILIVI